MSLPVFTTTDTPSIATFNASRVTANSPELLRVPGTRTERIATTFEYTLMNRPYSMIVAGTPTAEFLDKLRAFEVKFNVTITMTETNMGAPTTTSPLPKF